MVPAMILIQTYLALVTSRYHRIILELSNVLSVPIHRGQIEESCILWAFYKYLFQSLKKQII